MSRRAPLQVELLEDRCLLSASPLVDGAPAGLLVRYRADDGGKGEVRAVELPAGASPDQALAAYRADPRVLYAEPDLPVRVTGIPNDPRFGTLWGLHNTGQSGGKADADVDAPEAWDVTTGSTRNLVAVLDTGIDYRHIDLYRNIWINQAEIPTAVRALLVDVDADGLITFWDLNDARNQGAGKITDLTGTRRIDGGDLLRPATAGGWANGASDDGDAFVDDLIGWDFQNDDNDPLDDNDHGTHVAGILGATGNDGRGVAGVTWKVQMMALKFLTATGNGTTSNAIEALDYAVRMGAFASNNSWGGHGFAQTLYDAIDNARAHGHVFVTSAGNGGDDFKGDNIDAAPMYPAGYALGNVVTVTATTRNDGTALFSNYGPATVDLGAPGLHVVSTTRNERYSNFSGTSMAAPYVTGALALVRTLHPDWTYYQLIDQVMGTTDALPALAGKTAGGRLNLDRAVREVRPDAAGPRVVAAVPDATGARPVGRVRLTFSEGVDAATFTAASDIRSFTGPGGAVQVTGIVPVFNTDDRQFDVFFAPQSQAGTYQLVVGPYVEDLAGNYMDQDGDGQPGEWIDDRFAVAFVVEPVLTFTSTTVVPIRDVTTSVATLAVEQDVTIGDLNVRINITHTFDNDLRISLIAPDGTSVLLANRRGDRYDNFSDTVFDDEAARAIREGAAPFAGTFRPETPLSAFDGKNARGTWQLWIEDRAAGDVGRVNSWSLIIEADSGGAGASSLALPEPGDEAGGDRSSPGRVEDGEAAPGGEGQAGPSHDWALLPGAGPGRGREDSARQSPRPDPPARGGEVVTGAAARPAAERDAFFTLAGSGRTAVDDLATVLTVDGLMSFFENGDR